MSGKWVPVKDIAELNLGDIIKSTYSGSATFVVVSNHGTRATAARTADVTNPSEWLVFRDCGPTTEILDK